MPSWPFWAFFLVVGAGAMLFAKRLDDRERRRIDQRDSSAPPIARGTRDQT